MFHKSVTRPPSPQPFASLVPRGPDLFASTTNPSRPERENEFVRAVGVEREVQTVTDDAELPRTQSLGRTSRSRTMASLTLAPAPAPPGDRRRPFSTLSLNRVIACLPPPDLLGRAAANPADVRRLAEQGRWLSVHHCLTHPQAYVRTLSFRAACLELAALDARLRGAGAFVGRGQPHAWRPDPSQAERNVRRGTTTLQVSLIDRGAQTPADQAALDAERADGYRFDLEGGVDVIRRPWHDCAWGTAIPTLVLMSLLRRGCAQEAAELLAAGCWLPEKVTEAWTIYGDAPAVSVRAWRATQSPIAACLSGDGVGVQQTLPVLLEAGARPTLGERLHTARRVRHLLR